MFACIYIPDFYVAAIVRTDTLLRERAIAVLEGKPPLTRVVGLNEKARALGLATGMTKLQAEAFAGDASALPKQGQQPVTCRFPDLAVLRERSQPQECSAHAAVLDAAHAFSPRVEDTAPGTVLLDLAGLDRLYGPPGRMASQLAERIAALGMDANIAIAANPDAAMHAARGFSGATVLLAGEEAERLGVLPIAVLLDAFDISSPASHGDRSAIREQILDTFERWGIRNFRMLGLLPEPELASRLGDTGVTLRRLARGEGMRTLALCEPAMQFEEAMELESGVETIESLSFVLNRLLEELCARLEARALAAQQLSVRFLLDQRVADEETVTLDDMSHNVAVASVFERTLSLPVPMRDAKVFLKLLQLNLASDPPAAPVLKLWITAEPAPPRSAQRGLFLPITPEAEKLELTLARIEAVVGKRRVGSARLTDSHCPDNFQLEHFSVPADNVAGKTTPTMWDSDLSYLSLRMLRPPCRLSVQLTDGRPVRLMADNQKQNIELRGTVLWSAGPWRSSGDWWTETSSATHSGPWDREEWDIALGSLQKESADDASVSLYRIYRDLGTGCWYADASYD